MFVKNETYNVNMKKIKNFLTKFIPCAGLVAVSAIVIPLVCLSTKKQHILRYADDKNRSVEPLDEPWVIAEYRFLLTDDIEPQYLELNWGYTLTSEKLCEIAPFGEGTDKSSLLVQGRAVTAYLKIKSLHDSRMAVGDWISFNLFFTYKNSDGNTIWSSEFDNNYVYVRKPKN